MLNIFHVLCLSIFHSLIFQMPVSNGTWKQDTYKQQYLS